MLLSNPVSFHRNCIMEAVKTLGNYAKMLQGPGQEKMTQRASTDLSNLYENCQTKFEQEYFSSSEHSIISSTISILTAFRKQLICCLNIFETQRVRLHSCRIKEWLRTEGTSGGHLAQLPCSRRATQGQLPRNARHSNISGATYVKCSVALTIKKCFLM